MRKIRSYRNGSSRIGTLAASVSRLLLRISVKLWKESHPSYMKWRLTKIQKSSTCFYRWIKFNRKAKINWPIYWRCVPITISRLHHQASQRSQAKGWRRGLRLTPAKRAGHSPTRTFWSWWTRWFRNSKGLQHHKITKILFWEKEGQVTWFLKARKNESKLKMVRSHSRYQTLSGTTETKVVTINNGTTSRTSPTPFCRCFPWKSWKK